MPLFIFISGITYRMSCLKNHAADYLKIKKNTMNLVLIYILFGTMLPVLKIVFAKYVNNPVHLKGLLVSILLPQTLMWYIWVLIIYYWTFSIFGKKDSPNGITCIGLFALSTLFYYFYSIGSFDILCIKNLLYCAFYFYIGVYFEQLRIYINKVALIAASVGSMIEICYIVCLLFHPNIYNDMIRVLLDQISAVSMIIIIVKMFSNTKIGDNKVLVYLGGNSLVIYLLHTYLITFSRKVAIVLGLNYIFAITFCFTIPLIVCIVMVYLVNHNKILNMIFRPILIIERIKNMTAKENGCVSNKSKGIKNE